MTRIKLLLFYLICIGPENFFKILKSNIYEKRIIYYFELSFDKIKFIKPRVKSESKIFYSFDELPSFLKAKIKKNLGYEKLRIFKYRLSATIKLVVSFVDGEFASYCFLACSEEQFSLFRLRKNDIYFFDCFTFLEFRGLGLIYNETKYAIDIFKKHGYLRACVAIDSYNTDSICAFNKVGFYKTKEYRVRKIFFIKKIFVKNLFYKDL